jgi:hypothetical protein
VELDMKIEKIKILSIVYIILGIWFLTSGGIPGLYGGSPSPLSLLTSISFYIKKAFSLGDLSAFFLKGYFLLPLIYILIFILGVLLVATGAYILYIHNERNYSRLVKIDISVSLSIYSVFIITSLLNKQSIDSYLNIFLGIFFLVILYLIPILIPSILLIRYIEGKKQANNILFSLFIFINIIISIKLIWALLIKFKMY